jgi:phosphorylcholine metabolism protein LicD
MEILNDNKYFDLHEKYLYEIYLLVKRTTDLCHKYNIMYWIDGGTLLGSVRENNQIPYDNDADFGILQDDYDKFRKICEPILKKEYDYFIEESSFGFLKIFSCVCGVKYNNNERVISPCLDILVYENFNGLIAIKNRPTRHLYSKFIFFEKDLFPLKKEYIYSDLILYGAFNPYPYLERCYGDWKKRIYEKKY